MELGFQDLDRFLQCTDLSGFLLGIGFNQEYKHKQGGRDFS
jgi:hypothetical protein